MNIHRIFQASTFHLLPKDVECRYDARFSLGHPLSGPTGPLLPIFAGAKTKNGFAVIYLKLSCGSISSFVSILFFMLRQRRLRIGFEIQIKDKSTRACAAIINIRFMDCAYLIRIRWVLDKKDSFGYLVYAQLQKKLLVIGYLCTIVS